MLPANKREKVLRACEAITTPLKMIKLISSNKSKLPIMPNSSLKTEKIKSVVLSGKNSSWDCVPFNQPLPVKPPEPWAMVDWMIW